MLESRFYFADAAANGYLVSVIGKSKMTEVMGEVADTTGRVNLVLFTIVDAFIQRRRCAYRPFNEEN
jgi:hypothetical protein